MGSGLAEHRVGALELTEEVLESIDEHALACYPEECCGVLLGAASAVTAIRRTRNRHPGDRTRRYEIGIDELLEVQRHVRETGLEVVGYYHSHPDRRARPSSADRDTAWPEISYLIIAVRDSRIEERRAWRFSWRAQRFSEQSVVEGAHHESNLERG